MEDGFREEEDPLGTDTLRTASDRGRAHAHHAHHHPTHAVDGHHSYDKHDDDDDDDARHQDSLHRQHQHQQHTQAHTEYTYPVYDEPPELSPIDTPYTPGSRPVATQTTFDIDSLDPFAASVAFDSPTGDGIDGGIGSHVVAVVTPDDFYRDYRSASSTHYHHQHSRQPSSSSERAPMATSVPRPRDPASLRSNGNGTTAKHPPMPTALNGLRTATRSVSAPIDPSSTTGPKRLNNAARQPSVKDLTKKFDQGPPTAIPQLPVRTGIPSRPNKPATSSDKPLPTAPVGQRQTPYSTLRTSVDRNLTPDSAKATRSTQRTKFVAEDQTSNNSQSFASRIGKPRTPVALNAQPSQSTSTVSQKHSFQPTTASPNASPIIPQSQTLLFGEILPDQRDNHTLGHGIEGSGSRPRRTSESNVSSIRSAHQRTLSDPDLIEPSSPTDWYRIANDDTNGLQPQQTRHSKSHVRAQSDTPSIIPRKPPPPAVGATERSRAVSPSSRLPITVRKLASPTPSLSTSSPSGGNSRANSPSNLHRITPHGRPSRAASAQGYRSKTPTQSTRRAPPQGLTTPSNNGRLTPYGGEPVPKLSPPLRSSRPRQSVATATTTSSRMKALERARSPHYHATRNAQKSTEAPTRRRKISVGPVDFEQRREHIRLAYTKSIRDSQAREARLQAAERRKKELEVAARTKAALTASQAAANQDERTAHDHAAASDLDSRLLSPLKVPTGTECGEPSPTTLSPQPDVVKDSPTLGIPGSFPAGSPAIEFEEAPPSAISMATDVTEFDDEPQVFPPVQPDHGAASSGLGLALPDMPGSFTVSEADVPEDDERLGARTPPFEAPSTDEHVTYHDPFPREAVDDGHVSIKIAATDVPQQMPEEAPQMAEPQPDTASNSEAYKDEYEPLPYSSPSLETTVKILHRESDQFTKPEQQRRLQQRRNVIKELVDTEMVFVRDMNIVEEIYKGTAEACPKLDGKTSKIIFRNVDEIVAFHTAFLVQLKDAVAAVYIPQGRRSSAPKEASIKSNSTGSNSGAQSQTESDDAKDRTTTLGPLFQLNAEKMKIAHEGFLRNSDLAAKRLIQIQQDPTVQVWLNECHEVAKDLTAAWDLDSLLIKPMQRLTKYPNLILTILQHTPPDHPDRPALVAAKDTLEIAIIEINKTKKNFELVGQIVGRKRKESDVKAGFARAFGKRVDRLQATSTRIPEDPEYAKLHEKFGDDYLRLQVVLRDVEFYTRQVTSYVHEFLQYLSSMELVMRLQPGSYPEIESKWVQFNVSMRDIEKVALDQHLAQVRKQVIEPFELVIKAYGNPSLAMKKREKRRLDFERAEQIKKGGKTLDPKLKELVEQYDALNDTLIKELPQLSALTEKVGKICLENLVNIQAKWYSIWKDKVKVVLADTTSLPEMPDVVSTFQHDFKFAQEQLDTIGILHPEYKGRASQSTITTRASTEDGTPRNRPRPAELTPRNRGRSMNSEQVPALPTPEFKRSSGQFTLSPTSTVPSPHQYYYRDYYTNANATASGSGSGSGQRPSVPPSPRTEDSSPSLRAAGGYPLARPSTGRSYDSGGLPRESSDSSMHNRRDSNSTYNSGYPATEPKRYSGLFHSALPLPDSAEESQRSSRASSRERFPESSSYNVLWLAASLFEFNIETTKNEAGYPYLTYQAGEIFDVIAEKGELWLAKNQDDPREQVGWIWSKHFARLADS
ncbi:hypothetical protein VDGE_08713 [Verticillium dahliae]|uniref:DH domain-containing protein n=1 Tax=Verticillium dahliae TaxID=27337 RepID=A0A444S8B1_VERDA|nr:hypothetical protein VDGE_08713 [Verticillium dahliae]